jgi:hypothetical protein
MMKKMLWLISALILIITSCVTTSPETIDTKNNIDKKTDSVEKIETVIVDVFHVSSETLSASDGVVDGYIEYSYDVDGNLLEKKEFDGDKVLISTVKNEFSGDKIVKTQWFTGVESDPGIYIVKDYSGMNLVKETSYDIKDIPQSISTYEYDSNGLVSKWVVSSGDNVPMMVTNYQNSKGFRNSATFMTPLGEKEGSIKYTWIDGKISSEKTYDAKDNLEKSVEYEYEMGRLIKEIHYKKTVVDHTIEYELDSNGNALVKKYFYRSGNLKAQWAYEYVSFKKEVQK